MSILENRKTAQNSNATRRAYADMILEDATSNTHQVMTSTLAELWALGEHALVRQTIRQAGSYEQKAAWSNGTRALLPGDLMKDAFDRYMRS